MPSLRSAAERPRNSREPAGSVFCLSLRMSAEIGVVARIVQQIARRGLLPLSWHGTASGEHLLMDLQIAGLAEAEREKLAEALRQVVGVEEVLTSALLRRDAA